MTVQDYSQKWKLGSNQKVTAQNYEQYRNEINRRYLERLVQSGDRTSPVGNEYTAAKSGGFNTSAGAQPSQALGANPVVQPEAAPPAQAGGQPSLVGGWNLATPEAIPYAPAARTPSPAGGVPGTNLQGVNAMPAQPMAPPNPGADLGLADRMAMPGNAANRAPVIAPPGTPYGPSFEYQPFAPTTFLDTPENQQMLNEANRAQMIGSQQEAISNLITRPIAGVAAQFNQPAAPPSQAPGLLMGNVPTSPLSMRMFPDEGGNVAEGGGPGGRKGLGRPSQQEVTPPEGDVNGDGRVDLVDALLQLLGRGGNAAVEGARQGAENAQNAGVPQGELSPVMGPNNPTRILDWMKQQPWYQDMFGARN